MSIPGTFWFVFWRMALWGLGLGLGFGAAYGTLVGIPFYPFTIFGPPLGAMYGSIAGLPLGLLEGVVLGAVTVLLHRGGATRDPSRYWRAAELVCVASCAPAVTLFWGISFWRIDGPTSARAVIVRDLLETFILVAGPLLIATGASWWAARRVAVRYMDELHEPAKRGPAHATSET
jgi:hypothetical protein